MSLGTPRTPNYALVATHSFSIGSHEYHSLPAGAFVRPLQLKYVPAHIIERYEHQVGHDDVFCYTRYGIIPIPKSLLREV